MNNKYKCKDGVCSINDENISSQIDEKGDDNNNFPNEEDNWTIYGASWCRYCRKAKKLLENKEIKFSYYNIDNKIKEQLKPLIGSYNKIPIVLKGDKFIGGYNELKNFI